MSDSIPIFTASRLRTIRCAHAKKGDQTVDHVIYHCPILTAERATLIRSIVIKGLQWPISKSDLINQFKQEFITFCNKIDLENIQQ